MRCTVVPWFLLVLMGCSTPTALPLPMARLKAKEGKFQEAEAATQRGLADGKQADEWRILAAEIAIRQDQNQACLEHLRRLPARLDAVYAAPVADLGQLAFEHGFAEVAETALRAAIAARPDEPMAVFNLGFLLGFEGRSWEAARYQFETVRSGQFTPQHLVLLGAGEPVIEHPEMLEKFVNAVPDDPLPWLGEAKAAARKQEFARAEEILRQIIARDPHCGEAQGQLGRLLEPRGSERFREWNAHVPTSAEFHPEVWVARGLWARQQGQPEGAVRCLWEAIHRDPNHRVAHFQLGQLLMAMDRSEEAEPFLRRAKLLQELADLVDNIVQNPTDLERMRAAMIATENLGRPVEAWAWAISALQTSRTCRWAKDAQSRLQPHATTATAQVSEDAQLATKYDFSALSLPDFSPSRSPSHRAMTTTPTAIHFEDEVQSSGLSFTYRSRGPTDTGAIRMYETTGGGVAVLDYDGDHYPDLYFTQGGSVTTDQQPPDWTDRCFRNLGGTGWQDITAAAGLSDLDYGQGATTGDFDNDGFADLYVANLGRNRFYRNQGDGTFLDVTDIAGLKSERWTTSCLIADLNGDGWPDLYDVNYLSREDAIRATCNEGEELRRCSPDSFAAEQDQLFLSLGDGRFHDITTEAGIERPLGKGMGIIAADFDGSSRLSLFIANDAVPNFFFENQTASAREAPHFIENALQRGLALDAEGLPQACMGIAAGDVDGDRLLDMFVTNFYEQSNTLYLQRPGRLFEDATRRAGLREPSWKFLSFGTQCLDADLDGWLDLVVTNGHVLDLTAKNIPFRMRPQFFHNSGQGHFQEVSGPEIGGYFQHEYLGRGLARLDWNRDSLPDFVVSHIEMPATLVTNCTGEKGNFFAVRLVGTQGTRDAIGAEITIHAGDRVWTQHVVGGDGYQCRNENRLIFGLGAATHVNHWSLRWPSGAISEFGEAPANVELVAVENKLAPIILQGQPIRHDVK
ncbi:MAG: FG-GAP-like repeat-containing protein [Planctomycetaceae bacterium]|nr:FG-GAP-like repeat-containing protein [Planctomycetaceae bacterium]